ncbi:centrosome-associated zinc finger protein CP190 isoform X4 [Drosophila persimilis]|nr:centrosome-associated zinc finger protein CP190 isoform X4 [Drosophila persimilis]
MHNLYSQEAENTAGPWLCLECGIRLMSYRDFRLHLIGIHKKSIDPALCEYCGWRSGNNREKHFHMYTDHQINSPLYTFAECYLCDRKYLSNDELEAHMHECLSVHISTIEESDQDPENDDSIIYDIIIIKTEDDDEDDMPPQESFTSRQNQAVTPQQPTQTQLAHITTSDASLAKDGHRDDSCLQQAGERSGTTPHRGPWQKASPSRGFYSPSSPEYDEEKVWTVTNLSYALERDVVRLFPGEKLEDWRGNGKSVGTLYNRFRYRRRKEESSREEGEETL